MESYSTMRKKEIFATTWMNPESTVFNEISKTEKDKCCMLADASVPSESELVVISSHLGEKPEAFSLQ